VSAALGSAVGDPDSRLYRKAAGRMRVRRLNVWSKLCYMGHATMENRHGLAVAGMVTLAAQFLFVNPNLDTTIKILSFDW
jgi:hypothetical protein